MARKPKASKQVRTTKHAQTRPNTPTAEHQSLVEWQEEKDPRPPVTFPRVRPLPKNARRARDEDLDPQLIWEGADVTITQEQASELIEKLEKARPGEGVTIKIGDSQLAWRGKDQQDWSDLVVNVPPVYVQEKVHPKAIIDGLMRRSGEEERADAPDLFGDFNGPDPDQRTDFYQHEQHWSNRMILGDSLQVMASLADRERLRGQVQAIYFDPPYGIKFNSNWQVSTRSRDVKDGKLDSLTREPEQVKAFRDTWKDGIHSYLTYLRDRLTVTRDLLTESGSIFVQIGDENVHRVRAVMDEVFGEGNFHSQIQFVKNSGQTTSFLSGNVDYILWYGKKRELTKYRQLNYEKSVGDGYGNRYDQVLEPDLSVRKITKDEKFGIKDLPDRAKVFTVQPAISSGFNPNTTIEVEVAGRKFFPGKNRQWKYTELGLSRLERADRLVPLPKMLYYRRYIEDFPAYGIGNNWNDTQDRLAKDYVVQTVPLAVQRCLLITTDPGDLVLDPTCGSGTTATVAEQWGRRWITIDTSRVALALARQRLMGARYEYYHLLDSEDGRKKAAEKFGDPLPSKTPQNDLRQGFVYDRAPHVTLKSIANNSQIDTIWEEYQERLEPLRSKLNEALGTS